MINKLIPKTSGKIYIDGKDTDNLDPITLRREIGYAIQQIGLFPLDPIIFLKWNGSLDRCTRLTFDNGYFVCPDCWIADSGGRHHA